MGTIEQQDQLEQTTIKVLIADDDAPTRILLRAAISQWGYDVIEAKDGEEAWNIIREKNGPQLLILDWLMPKLDGIALCQLSKHNLPIHPYIILLTQVTGTTNITKGLDAGADEFLSKPFNMAELRSRLSIGARVIHYKNMLANQIRELQHCMTELRSCEIITAELKQDLDHALPEKPKNIMDKIARIQDHISTIIISIESLQPKKIN